MTGVSGADVGGGGVVPAVPSAVLALDVGTSALKAALVGPDGAVLATAAVEYGLPAGTRQDPEMWWQAASDAVARLAPGAVEGLVLTGTMENLVGVDVSGRPTAPAMLYADPAGADALAELADALAGAGAERLIGNAPEPLMTAFKWRHARDAEPALAAAPVLLPGAADALSLRLTGRATTDPVTATTTGLMDIARRQWSPDLCRLVGIDMRQLPALTAAGTPLGPMLPEAARHLGLPAGTPVIQGCGDAGASTLGSFCDGADELSIHLGTTGWLARTAPAATLAAPRSVYRLAHPFDDGVIEITPILAAGAAAAWARQVLGLAVDEADRLAAEADHAPADILFLPYLSGERSPFLDLAVRGGFLGLDARHGPGDLMRAVLEGVAFAIHANLERLGRPGGTATLIGGGAASRVWPAILADTLDCPLWIPEDPQAATAVGAWRLAARGLGRAEPPVPRVAMVRPRRERQIRANRLATAFDAATAMVRRLAPTIGPGLG